MKRAGRKKMGRPPLPPEERRNALVTVRLKKVDRDRLEREAEREGLTISGYLLKCWREKGVE